MPETFRDLDFYQGHLDRVSRSFAFCIRKLEPPLRLWVSLSYLLCRVLDTIEDSPWTDTGLREAEYVAFDGFMRVPPSREDVAAWAARFPRGIPETEKLLLAESYDLFADLHLLPPAARAVIQKAVRQMSAGMKSYAERARGGGLRLRGLTDVNRYCYFVAGVVGELLSNLFVEYRADFIPPVDFLKNSFHFGLFLQKINLLKDQVGDEAEGRYLVPNRPELLASLRENAEGALNYLLSLPVEEKGFRTFCAWSLFLGAASLPFIEENYGLRADAPAHPGTKISRAVTEQLLAAVEEIVQDNGALRAGFDENFPPLPALDTAGLARHPADATDSQWFAQVAAESLGSGDLGDLRMI
jgi:phytoene/squalene synthetase